MSNMPYPLNNFHVKESEPRERPKPLVRFGFPSLPAVSGKGALLAAILSISVLGASALLATPGKISVSPRGMSSTNIVSEGLSSASDLGAFVYGRTSSSIAAALSSASDFGALAYGKVSSGIAASLVSYRVAIDAAGDGILATAFVARGAYRDVAHEYGRIRENSSVSVADLRANAFSTGEAIPKFAESVARSFYRFVSGLFDDSAPNTRVADSNDVGQVVGFEEMPIATSTDVNELAQALQQVADTAMVPERTVERIVERTPVVSISGISESELSSRLQQLDNKYASKLAEITASNSRQFTNTYQVISQTNKIDNLSGVTLTNATVSGVTGLTDADIPDNITVTLSGYLATTGGTLTGAITNTATATSTFSGGFSAATLAVTSTTASSTFANGINLTGGCFSINGTCLGGSSTYLGLTDTPSSFTANRIVHTNSAGTALTDTAGFVFTGTNFGIGTTTPWTTLSVAGIGSFDDYARASYFSATSTTATSTFAGGATFATGGGLVGVGTTSPWATLAVELGTAPGFVVGNEGSTTPAFYVAGVNGDGGVGVGTTGGAGRRLDVLDVANPQLRLSQSSTTASVYTDFQVAAATGDLTLSLYPSTSANDIFLVQPGGTIGANLWVCQGSACPSLTIANGGNVIAENAYYFGNGYKLDQVSGTTTEIGVYNTAGTAIIIFDEY